MSEKDCNCHELKETGRMIIEYLRSIHNCLSNGDKILPKDLADMQDIIDKGDKTFK